MHSADNPHFACLDLRQRDFAMASSDPDASGANSSKERPPLLTGPVRQHYVPKFYLKSFAATDGCVAVVERSGRSYRASPLNTAVQKHFYTFRDDDGQMRYELEAALSDIESQGSEAISHLIGRTTFDQDDRRHLAAFISMLHVRTPAMVESVQHGTGELTKKLLGRMFHSHDFITASLKMMPQFSHLTPAELDQTASRMSEFVRTGEYTLEVDHQFSLASSVSMANEVAAILMQRTWTLIQAPDRHAFITTDAPVVLTAATPSSQMRGVGFASADAVVLCPLRPNFMLVMEGAEEKVLRAVADARFVRRLNILVAQRSKRFVLGRDDALVASIARASGLTSRGWKPAFSVL